MCSMSRHFFPVAFTLWHQQTETEAPHSRPGTCDPEARTVLPGVSESDLLPSRGVSHRDIAYCAYIAQESG